MGISINPNELLTPPDSLAEPDTDAALSASDSAPTEGFVYERADGTVERALDAEDAIARCPVLGKMSVEQANVLLELAAIGKEQMEAQARQAEAVSQAKQKPGPELTDKAVESKNVQKEVLAQPEDSILASAVATTEREVITGSMDEQARIHRLVMDQQDELRHRQITEAEGATEAEVGIDARPLAEKSFINSRATEPGPVIKPEDNVNQIPVPESVSADTANDTVKLPTENRAAIGGIEDYTLEVEVPIVEAAADNVSADGLAAKLPESYDIGDAHMLPLPETPPPEAEMIATDVSVGEKIVADDEVVNTYEQLVTLINPERKETSLATSEPNETSVPDEIVLLSQELADAIQANRVDVFEEFVMVKTPPETSPDIDTIVAEADNQTLEETLVQLSYCLAETVAEPTDKSRQISEALEDLAKILPPGQEIYKSRERRAAVTPEMTQKLLTLLRAVGYDNPREILVGFVERNDFEFLLQAIRYLYQLSDSTNQQEFLSNIPVNSTPMNADEPFTTRLGRAIMQRFFLHNAVILPA